MAGWENSQRSLSAELSDQFEIPLRNLENLIRAVSECVSQSVCMTLRPTVKLSYLKSEL